MFLLNIFLAVIWVGLTGEFTPTNFAVGLVLVAAVIGFSQETTGRGTYLRRLVRVTSFLLFFLKELLFASLFVTASILRRSIDLRPGVIAVPLDLKTDVGITLLSNLITLTPGTLTLDVSDDRRTLYVHTIDFEDAESFRQEIKDGFERRILELIE